MNHATRHRTGGVLPAADHPALDELRDMTRDAASPAQRERIATAALVGLLSAASPVPTHATANPTAEHLALRAVRHADALIDALNRRG